METPTPKSKPDLHVYAKFLIQKITFFGTVKRILTIHKTGFTIEAFSKDPQHQENYSFNDLSVIEAPSRSENEIILATKKSASQSLFCYDRAKCICAIYYAWDKYILSVSPRLEKSFPSFEVFKMVIPTKTDLCLEVQLVIFRTHLELNHKALKSSKALEEKYTQMEPSQSGLSSTTTIPFCEIKNIYKSHSSIVIEMKGSLTRHHLLYYDLEKVNNIISKIQSNYKEYVEDIIYVVFNEPKLETNQAFHEIKSTSSFFFECKLHKLLESGHLFPIKVAISDDYLLELDITTNYIIQKYDLRNVQAVVQMVSGVPGICICFEDNTMINYIPEHKERDIIASNFFTLINWRKTTQDTYARQGDFIHCTPPNINYKVHCWVDQETDTEYEAELIKEMSTANNEDDLYRALHEFNINATLKNYTDSDPKALLALIKLFGKNLKTIKSKQFLKYWESLQNNLTESSPTLTGTSDNPPSHRERAKSIGYYETDEQLSIQLNIKPFLSMLFKTEELLKGIIILISSKPLFKEIANSKKEAAHYEEFIKDVLSLIDAPYPTLNHLAGSFLRAFCRFPFPTEKKTEIGNKKYLLSSKIEILQFVSQSLAAQVLVEKGKKSFYNNYEVTSIHSILASLRVLRTYIYDRRETTEQEDFKHILRLISKAYYFAIMNFLFRSHSIACVYNTTMIMNSIFQNHEFPDLEKKLQNRFLSHSSLIPLNMILIFSSSLFLQRKLSMILLSNVLSGNEEACEVLLRLFPKYLFTKVDAAATYITTWDLQKWEQFFSILVQNYDNPMEQWNEDCRKELLSKLREADKGVISMFVNCPPSKLHEYMDPTFKNDGESLLNIRWNYEEFGIHYAILEAKVLVWKYFLVGLLKDTEKPALVMQIQNPTKFWNELNIRFITSANVPELRKVLKTLILLYQEYTDEIKELNNMSFWLKCIRKQEYADLRYLILQLIYTCLSAENPKISHLNLLKFIELNGLSALADVLVGLYFSEDHNDLTMDEYEMYRASAPLEMDYNYTKLQIPKQGYAPSFKKAMSIYFLLQIYKLVVQKSAIVTPPPGDKFFYPLPKAKRQLIGDKSIHCLVNILLLNDDDLALEVLDLILTYFLDQESLEALINKTPLFDFLLVNINSKTISSRFTLILQIYHKIADQFPEGDNPIKAYTGFSFNPTSSEVEKEAFALFSSLKYFPKAFIWKLINVGVDDFVKTFFSPAYESPELIWTTEMRENLINSVKSQVAPYKTEIINYTESRKEHSRNDIPDYTPEKTGVEYDNITEEVACGPIMLRIWAKKGFRGFDLSKEEIPSFIKSLYSLLEQATTTKQSLEEMDEKQRKDLLVILGAHAKAIKLYSIKVYEQFPEIIKILGSISERVVNWDPRSLPNLETQSETSAYLLALHKIVYRAAKQDKSDNLDVFLDSDGFSFLLDILRSLVRKISMDNLTEASNYYGNLKVTYSDLKTLNLAIRILNLVHLQSPSHINSLNADTKLQLFLNLQVLSKISIILFKYIQDKYDETQKKLGNDSIDEEEFGEDEEDEDFNVALTSVFDILKKEKDSSLNDLCMKQLLSFTKSLSVFLVDLSLDITMAPFFIQSGIAWRSLEWLTYYNDPNHYTRKIEDSNYQATVGFLEKMCNALRNILIFSNEALILKSASASIKAVNVGLTTTKAKSPELLASLEKLEGFERTILSKFQTAVFNLLGKPLLQLLLTDYYEPILNPQDEDKDNVLRFMKIFSTNFNDPRTLWNEETKEELKELIITQIIHINESHGKAFFNEVEPFEYKCYDKQLIIDGVFISAYNRVPDWKIANPRQFIMKMLEAVTQIWEWIKEFGADPNLDAHELSSRLFKLNDAAAGISNIIAYHGSEEVLLFEGNLTRLGSLLSDKSLKDINDPYIPRLKSMVLSIFLNLSKKLNGALKVVENVTIMRSIVLVLRENSKEGFYLSKKAINIVENISNFDNLRPALIRYGFSVILLESSLKSEIFARSLREKSFALFVHIIQGKDALSLQLFKTAFPSFIQELILQTRIPQEEVLEMLDKGCDEPKFMWTKFMRYETLLMLTKVCDTIQHNWTRQQGKEIKIIEHIAFWEESTLQTYPVLPEIQNNLVLNGIFLKNFNKKPELDEQDNLSHFITSLVSEGRKFMKEVSKNSQIHQQEKDEELHENSMSRQNHILATILTSLLLSLDLVMTKPERKASSGSRKSSGSDDKDQAEEKKAQKDSTLDDETISFIGDCLEFVATSSVEPHIMSTILELAYLITDDAQGCLALKNRRIVHTISKIVNKVAQTGLKTHIEEKLVLYLLLKVLYGDKTLIPEIIEECLQSFKRILGEGKFYLREVLESIVTIIAQDINHGREAFMELNHERELISVSVVHDCIPSKTIDAFWKHLVQGWNPYNAKNTINNLMQKAKDYRVQCPLLSDYAVQPLPYANEQSMLLEVFADKHISAVIEEYTNSRECSSLD